MGTRIKILGAISLCALMMHGSYTITQNAVESALREQQRQTEITNYILDVVCETDWYYDNINACDTMTDEQIYNAYKAYESAQSFVNPFDDDEWVNRCNAEMDSLADLSKVINVNKTYINLK